MGFKRPEVQFLSPRPEIEKFRISRDFFFFNEETKKDHDEIQ